MAASPLRLMIVDDHRLLRKGIARLLDLEPGMTVIAEAGNGEEAVEQFRRHTPDVTLMDLELPRMDGIEAITVIRREYPNARMIALTMYQGDEDIHRAVQAGAVAYLLKDTVPEVLIRVIRDVHAGRRVFAPEILAAIEGRAGQPALTSREVQVLELLAEGKRTKEIAAALGVTSDTANAHIKNIYSKFAVHGRGAVVSEAIRRGFIRRERSTFPI
ncbi:MAG: response regulator transcription factor [Acidobacteriota bacterium]